MTVATRSLKIGGIDVSLASWLDYDQPIEPIGGSSFRRMANGAGFKTTHWVKHRVSISAAGWVPPAINAIDYGAPFELELPLPVTLNVGEVLPAGWSTRAAPWAERTLTDAAGRSARHVYIKMTVFSEGPKQTNGNTANPSWELICEEA